MQQKSSAWILVATIYLLVTETTGLDSLAPQAMELDQGPVLVYDKELPPTVHPRRHRKLYDEIVINDPQPHSAGLYIRVSQKGADYLTALASKALPRLLLHLVLPNVEEESYGFKAENIVITRILQPTITTRFVDGSGVSLTLALPDVEIEADCSIDMFFSAEGHALAKLTNWTINMDVAIERGLGENRNNITVTNCKGHVPVSVKFFGHKADELNSFSELIGSSIEDRVKAEICQLPHLLNAFFEKQQEEILSEKFWNETRRSEVSDLLSSGRPKPKIEDHLCSDLFGTPESEEYGDEVTVKPDDYVEEHDALQGFGNQLNDIGTWAPDLTLRFPPTFSNKDIIFGIDGGIVLNGQTADIDRPKFANVTVIRDQMAGLIVSEYVPNAFLYHVFEKSLGSFVESFNLRHVPKSIRPFARVICADCMVILKANLTQRPHVTIDRNGIVLLLEGDVGASFYRKNKTHELLSADGVIRVVLKPQFRNSRVFSDVELTGVDFKIYKVGLSGMFANAARKVLNFIIPKAIWPRVQKSLRFAINRRGIKLPTFCGVQFEALHVDYIRHAALLSADFTVDTDFFIRSFKQFLEADVKYADGIHEYHRRLRYLKK